MGNKYIIERYPNTPSPHLVIWRQAEYSKIQEYVCAISYERTLQTHEKDALAIIHGLTLRDQINRMKEIRAENAGSHNADSLDVLLDIINTDVLR